MLERKMKWRDINEMKIWRNNEEKVIIIMIEMMVMENDDQ